ncbi:hypothetical protein [Pontivivens ytuae]|uniref:Porin n=1 Tax=Pontivivens ytuae TaxID=2789856 RepID=A0A7S9LTT8_9RHOB|nr:hypothetical protein [Pontivivens ytuae]QPH55186.1 hypothetical protein I0K15_05450 [Pontivivens ytuae]
MQKTAATVVGLFLLGVPGFAQHFNDSQLPPDLFVNDRASSSNMWPEYIGELQIEGSPDRTRLRLKRPPEDGIGSVLGNALGTGTSLFLDWSRDEGMQAGVSLSF